MFFASYAYSGMLGQGPGAMRLDAANYELGEFTQALYNARERAMGQISAQAAALGAAGVVGVRIGHTIQPHTLSGGMGGRSAGSARASCGDDGHLPRDRHRDPPARATPQIQAPEPVVDLSLSLTEQGRPRRHDRGARDRLRPILPGGRARGRPRAPGAEPRGPVHLDLSVNEFLLVKQAGFEPLGLVVGSSIYHIGIQLAGWKKARR